MNADEIKTAFKENVDNWNGAQTHHGTIVGVLKKALANNDENYRLVLKALTGKRSSKELNEAEWAALFSFVQPYKPEGGHWTSVDLNLLVESCKVLVVSEIVKGGSDGSVVQSA